MLLLALAPQEVSGLRPGEHAQAAGGRAAAGGSDSVQGRVLDGVTSAPLAGAEVELWTEGDGPPPALLVRGKSRADGSFVLAASDERPHGDKLLIRAAGFRSTLVGRSDADEVLLCPVAKHLQLRAVDLDGEPIAGARVESRQTCAHAPPAFVATSDALGRFDLATFPPLDDEPELVVSARGYGAVLLQEPERMLAPDGLEARLPRRRPLAFQVVDSLGRPLARQQVSLGEEPHWSAVSTSVDGRAVFDSPFFGRAFVLKIEQSGSATGEFLASGRFPSSFEPRFVHVPIDAGQAKPEAGTVPIHVVDAGGRAVDVPVGALREKGSTRHGLEGVKLLGADGGRTTLVAGGPFTGWNEAVKVLDAPAETTLTVEREPVLEIVLPPDTHWLVHVQAGDDSITLENPPLPLRQGVPAGKPIVVCAVGEKETRLSRLGQILDDARLDLTRTSSIVARLSAGEPPSARSVRVIASDAAGHVRLADQRVEAEGAGGELRFDLPARAGFEGRVGAPGCVPVAIGPWLPPTAQIELHRRGSLTLRGKLAGLSAGGSEGQAIDGGFRVDDLAPGPLLGEATLPDGRVVALELVLGDGEQRELSLP